MNLPCAGALLDMVDAAFAAEPGIAALLTLRSGTRGRIVRLLPSAAGRLDRLACLGILPGVEVRLCQRAPSVVIEAGETMIALDPAIAAGIVVQVMP
jgi:DtxR family transcriptional regulator, Mn-dependent transcriptional regulator